MLIRLIELAEEMYNLGQNPFLDSSANGAAIEDYAIQLGHLIQEVGKILELQKDAIKDRDEQIKALQHELSQ
jgi:hypothetical protein